ncbi:MAG: glucosaminidase domain-containing protein [Flavipsychrobacter sp.]
MVKLRLRFLVIALIAFIAEVKAQKPELVEEYINTYRELAMSEQVRVGIPAAVTLAQGIHETGAGTSRLATLGNNHFGIKCKRDWKGQTIKHTDDAPNECFRKYNYPLDSYKDHSDYLSNNPRYASLFKLSITDYAAWCVGLRRAGYATNPRYAQMLIKLIEDYKLQQYTYAAMGNNSLGDTYATKRENEIIPNNDPVIKEEATNKVIPVPTPTTVSTTVATVPVVTKTVSNSGMKVAEQRTVPVREEHALNHPPYGQPVKVNGLRAVYAKEGQAPLEYAIKNSIRYKRFLELNDLNEKILSQDMYLYLERKHFRGVRPMHMVKPGESMHSISQKEGIQLKYLRELNFMLPGEEPVPGIVLELQNKAKEKPRVYEVPKEEVVKENSSTQSAGYVKTNRSPIPSNPRYVAPSATVKEKSAIKVTTTPPQTSTATSPIAKELKEENTIAYKTETSTPKEEESIDALKKKFDDVLYNKKENKESKKEETTTNPRYVPQSNRASTITKTVKVPVEKTETPVPVATEPVITKPSTDKKVEKVVETPTDIKEDKTAEKKITIPVIGLLKKKQEEDETKEEVVAQAEPVVKEEPKSELDKLKAQFDAVVYDSPKEEAKVKTMQKVPTSKTTEVVKQKEQEDPSKYYVVKDGDTAFSIAKKHKISMRQLMDWNDLDFDAIKTGMKLQVKK